MTGWVRYLSGRVFARSPKGPGFEPWLSHNFSPATSGAQHKKTLWRGGLVCMSFVEGSRKFVDFPTGNSWTNLKSPGKCVTRVGFRWRIVGDMTGWQQLSSRVFGRPAKGPGFEPRSSHNFSPVTNEPPCHITNNPQPETYPGYTCIAYKRPLTHGRTITLLLPWTTCLLAVIDRFSPSYITL